MSGLGIDGFKVSLRHRLQAGLKTLEWPLTAKLVLQRGRLLKAFLFMEIWKEIEGLPGRHISNLGRVKADEVKTKFGNQFKTYPERFLNIWYSRTGYNYIDISVCGKVKRFLLHRLVALHFIPNTENKPQVNHKDGNKNNNHYNNLEWATAAENLQHARDLGLNNSIGCHNKGAKFTAEQIIYIRKSNKTITDLSKEFSVSLAILSRIRSLKSYKNVG